MRNEAHLMEEDLWKGSPSQVTNLGYFIVMGLFFFLVIPLFLILWRWLVTKNIKYRLTNQRLMLTTGVLNKVTENLELYRVKDIRIDRPLFLRLFSLGNIVLQTSDATHPEVTLRAVPRPEVLRDVFRKHIESERHRRRVREFDVT